MKKSIKRNILVITSSYPLNDAQSDGSFIEDYCVSLNKTGLFNIHVLAPHKHLSAFYEKRKLISVTRFPYFYPYHVQDLAYEEGLPYKIHRSLLNKLQLIPFIISELSFSIKLIMKESIDLIHSQWMIPQGLIGSICKRLFRIPHIVTIHSSEITFLKKMFFGETLIHFILSNSDALVSVSKHRAIELLNYIETKDPHVIDKIRIIPMGVDLPKKQNKSGQLAKTGTDFTLLFVGRLTELKGCRSLLKTMPLLKDGIPNLKLYVLGTGPLEKELIQYVINNKLENYVIFKGFIPHAEVSNYYSIADISLILSKIDKWGYQEGLPVVLLESMSFGLPIIGTNTPGIKEVIKNRFNGLLVEPSNEHQLCEAILELYNDSKLRGYISMNAKNNINKYSWENTTINYLAVYNEILK